MTDQTLMQLNGVGKIYRTADGTRRAVLEGVDFSLAQGEIVALLGKSGSGKSTLLRIIAGLIDADGGQVRYRDQPVNGPTPGVSMVFQSFALFPWLTVQQNVELGLEARGIPREEREKRADEVIDMIGLSGFNGALPRELSGGMRQRVGIARAIVTQPDILLMDEAFSALDVLTGQTLRDDILELWEQGNTPMKAILVVSHNIEEAVVMADRIVLLSSDPGRIRAEMRIDLPRPRDPANPEVRALIDEVYTLMTSAVVKGERRAPSPFTELHLGSRLPDAPIGHMEAVLERLAAPPFNGSADLPQLAEESELPDDQLLPVYETLKLFGLAHIEHGDIALTPLGQRYVHAEQPLRHELFGQQVLQHVPLAAHIRAALEQQPSGELTDRVFLGLLEQFLKPDEARETLHIAIDWGRYGELYEYHYHNGVVSLPEEAEADVGDA